MKAELIDYMGSDLTVVNAARVSFDKESDWEEVCPCGSIYPCYTSYCMTDEVLRDKDKKLIHYLAKHNHFTPFTHCVITLRETVPIFVARQRFKHTVGFTYNEVSRRYVDDTPEFYVPDVWRKRAENVKQGSSDEAVNLWEHDWHYHNSGSGWEDWSIGEELADSMERIVQTYKKMIEVGVAPEQARMILPQSMYTSYYCTGSLSAFARAYNLRSEESAQKETQDLAEQWSRIIEPLFPESWKALTQ